jgi:hypothetical protein
MKRTTVILIAIVLASPLAVATAADMITDKDDDALAITLRGYGFLPVVPPSTLMTVGSLYYVDSKVKYFKAICHADKADLENRVDTSSSFKIQENLERSGQVNTGIDIDFGWTLGGKFDKNYVVKVQSSVTDVVLKEIPLGPNWTIFREIMQQPECNEMALSYVRSGGYVCQGQKILNATVEFKLDRDTQNKLESHASATPDTIKDIVKQAVETRGEQAVVKKEGRLLGGSALTYGVSMNPVCFAPPESRFRRVLPSTTIGRVTNYVLFNIVEPLFPAKVERTAVAQASNVAM